MFRMIEWPRDPQGDSTDHTSQPGDTHDVAVEDQRVQDSANLLPPNTQGKLGTGSPLFSIMLAS